MLRVACVMMQKDETLLLRPWLAYYGAMFGHENLFVIDNGSADERVCATLAEYERLGVSVDRTRPSRMDYENKGVVIAETLRTLQALGVYDFLLPLDCDEFLSLRKPGRYSFDPGEIDRYLMTLLGEPRVLRIPFQFANHPLQADIYHHFSLSKVFFAGGAFESIDHCNQVGQSIYGGGHVDTELVQFHFHFKEFGIYQRQARRNWRGSISLGDADDLKSYQGESAHLAPYLLKDRDEFYRHFLSAVHLFVPELGARLSALGAPLQLPGGDVPDRLLVRPVARDPAAPPVETGVVALLPRPSPDGGVQFVATTFNETAYLAANPDLAKTEVQPTAHFCEHGFREGRPIYPARGAFAAVPAPARESPRPPVIDAFFRYSEEQQSRHPAGAARLCLELGASDKARPGWLATDLYAGTHVAPLDVCKPFPFPSQTFDFIYSEHMIEHVPLSDGQRMIQQCFRVLKPGGVLRLATPGLSFLLHLLSEDRSDLEDRYIEWAVSSFVPSAPKPLPSIVFNNFVRAWGHQFIYDRPTLRHALHHAGFRNTVECRIGESAHPELRHLENEGRLPEGFLELETMILEATRTG